MRWKRFSSMTSKSAIAVPVMSAAIPINAFKILAHGVYEKREVVNSSYEQQAYEMGKNV